MNERAKAAVYWLGITGDIAKIRSSCSSCNRATPSQPRTPPIAPWIPTTPFEAIAVDYFHYKGKYYFVATDRLSGWTETQLIKLGTKKAGAEGLCSALRRIFVTFGVPVEISIDGGGGGRVYCKFDQRLLSKVGCQTSNFFCILCVVKWQSRVSRADQSVFSWTM